MLQLVSDCAANQARPWARLSEVLHNGSSLCWVIHGTKLKVCAHIARTTSWRDHIKVIRGVNWHDWIGNSWCGSNGRSGSDILWHLTILSWIAMLEQGSLIDT